MLRIRTFFSFLPCLSLITSVCGSLYPTYPIASTTWRGERIECVTWIDDGSHPTLDALGRLDVDLYVNGHTRIATLASNVSPESKFHKFKILPSWGPDSHNYHVRFVSHQPPVTFYSADFSISDMDYNSTSAFTAASLALKHHEKEYESSTNETRTRSTSTTSISLYTPVMTLVLPDTTIVSTLAPTTPRPTPSSAPSQLAAAAITSAPTQTPAVVIDPNSNYDGRENQHGGTRGRKSGSAGASNRRVDMEKLKFRVVFILWPVLIGVSMAL